MDFKKRTAFTLAEMMVVLLVLSLIMAAFLPVITRRTRQTNSNSEIWKWAANGSDIHWGDPDTYGAVIGANAFPLIPPKSGKLFINTKDNTIPQILFGQQDLLGPTATGQMLLDNAGNLGIGYTKDLKGHSTVVGIDSEADENNSTLLGYQVNSAMLDSTIIGAGARASYLDVGAPINTNGKSVALGAATHASRSYTTSIGADAKATSIGATALGYGTEAVGICSIAIGSKGASAWYDLSHGEPNPQETTDTPTSATEATGAGSIAIGIFANASGIGAVAVGPIAKAAGSYSTAFGAQSNTQGNYSMALGYTADTGNFTGSVAIGTDSGGKGAAPRSNNEITLGTDNHSVNIPGKLFIGTPYTTFSTPNTPLVRANSSTPSGGIFWTSDRRLKNIKGKSKVGLNEIRQIEVDDYTFKADKRKTPQIGVIAQDLQKVFPNSVTVGPNKYFSVSQNEMFYAMLNSIKQLDGIVQGWVKDFKALIARIQSVEDKIVALVKVDKMNSEKIKSLEAKNKQLEARLTKLEKQCK